METEILRETLASVQHAIWAHWMNYMFSVCRSNGDGSYTIPLEKVQRWQRQARTPYHQLNESEKDSDREQADRILQVLEPPEPPGTH